MVVMVGGARGSEEVFMRASNPTSASWYHPQALRFQTVLYDEHDSYHEEHGELFISAAKGNSALLDLMKADFLSPSQKCSDCDDQWFVTLNHFVSTFIGYFDWSN